MMKNRKLTCLMHFLKNPNLGKFNKYGILLTMLIVIAFAGVLITVAQGASLKPEIQPETMLLIGGGFAVWDEPQRIDDTPDFLNMGDRSMAKDENGFMHVAYGGDRLYHAWFNGNNWETEVVDSSPYVGQYTSIAIYEDQIHISYYDARNGYLKYARKSGAGGWVITTVDQPNLITTLGEEAPIILEEDDLPKPKPWLSPQLQADSANSINIPTAPANGGVGLYSSIALDAYHNPHIAYYDAVNQKLRFASYDGLNWSTEEVRELRTSYREGKYVSLTYDRLNRPHMSFLEDSHDSLRYAYREGNNWRFAYPDTGGNVGGYTSIIVDDNLNVHISYCKGPLDNNVCRVLRYATAKIKDSKPDGWGWHLDEIDSGLLTGTYSSIAKSGNIIYISYFEGKNRQLKVATRKKDPVTGEYLWSTQAFDSTKGSNKNNGYFTSIAIDNDGRFHVAYLDLADGIYKELYYDTAKKKYLTRPIDSGRDVGLSTSLALDSGDKAHISYMDDTSDDLRYATNSSGSWATSIISATGDVGVYSAIAVDSGNVPHVAYYDIEGGDLEYATLSGGNWVTTTVDYPKDKDTGLYPDIVISPVNNLPYISYYNAADKDLMLARFDGSRWITNTVDSLGNVGKFTSIDMDAAGRIYISYYDEKQYDGDSQRLKFAYWTGSSWVIRTVDSSFGVGTFSSIDVDNTGRVHIAYYDAANKALKYAQGVLSGDWIWTVETVDGRNKNGPDVGTYASIGVNILGTPYISYYDATNGDLKLASKLSNGRWIIQTLDTEGDVGRFTSLAISNLGFPHISYYDNTYGDLKYLFVKAFNPIVAEVFLPMIAK